MELKLADDTWSSSFSKYSFTSCQLEIMQHFNLRYECLDARVTLSSVEKGYHRGS